MLTSASSALSTTHFPLEQIAPTGTGVVTMPAGLCRLLLRRAQELNAAGLKGFGLLVGDPTAPGHPFRPVDVVLFDPRRNRRNEPRHRAAFHAQGTYFRRYDDAGFVADPADLLAAWRQIENAGLEPVAPFHVHRRQPANFSLIDYRLHNPAFSWHLIISLRNPSQPVVQPFRVTKDPAEFGIGEDDEREGSELSYPGPEVGPLELVLTGSRRQVQAIKRQLHPAPQVAGGPRGGDR
jgi:proteasome lid subunit RPN8/RPN11